MTSEERIEKSKPTSYGRNDGRKEKQGKLLKNCSA